MKKAFTMIELVFVIVILGILASIGVSKMAVTRNDAMITKGRSDVASIRSAITLLHSTNMMSGKFGWPGQLDDATKDKENQELFDGNTTDKLLDYPIISKDANGHWMKTDDTNYTFNILNQKVPFTYDGAGKFTCDSDKATAPKTYKLCEDLTH